MTWEEDECHSHWMPYLYAPHRKRLLILKTVLVLEDAVLCEIRFGPVTAAAKTC